VFIKIKTAVCLTPDVGQKTKTKQQRHIQPHWHIKNSHTKNEKFVTLTLIHRNWSEQGTKMQPELVDRTL